MGSYKSQAYSGYHFNAFYVPFFLPLFVFVEEEPGGRVFLCFFGGGTCPHLGYAAVLNYLIIIQKCHGIIVKMAEFNDVARSGNFTQQRTRRLLQIIT